MPRTSAPSAVIFDFERQAVVCNRCNQSHAVPLPATVTSLIGFLKACLTVHASCKPAKE